MSIFGATDTPVSDFWRHPPLGFKARVGSALFELCRGIRDIRSPRFTSGATPLPVYIASIAAGHFFPHACFSRGRMLDLNHRPPAWQADPPKYNDMHAQVIVKLKKIFEDVYQRYNIQLKSGI